MPEPTVLAYLAGVIDSDGYITITKAIRKGRAYFGAAIGISGTRTQPHELAASLWGGKIHTYQPKNPRHRAQFQWVRHGDHAIGPILDVQPYLRVKQEQARIALEAQEHILFGRGDDPYPWMSAGYSPEQYLSELRDDMVYTLNQGRRITPREPDGRTWDEFPGVHRQAVIV